MSGSTRTWCAALLVAVGTGLSAPAVGAHAATTHKLSIAADFVLGAEGAPKGAPACVPNAVFHPGEQVVWRAVISDASTGKPLTQAQIKQMGVTASVVLASGGSVKMIYAAHPPAEAHPKKQAFYWVGPWKIGAKYPMGPLSWSIKVSDNLGDKATFAPIGQDVGIPTIIIAPAGSAGPAS